MQVVLISNFFLSPNSVDSTSSIQMVKAFKEINPGIEIHIVTSDDTYKNNSEKGRGYLDLVNHIHVVKSIYSGKNTILLLLASLIVGLRLVLKARSLRISNVISLTNPPLISVWCALLLRNRNWAYWSFDLYPDALVANEMVSEKNIIYKMIDFIVYKSPPSFLICLGEKQRDYLFKKYGKELPCAILPCGVIAPPASDINQLPFWFDEGKKYIGYVGNVGKAHSKQFIIEVIENIEKLSDFTLILAIYGEHKVEIERIATKKKLDNVYLVDSVTPHHLHLINIHLVSLLPSWTNVSVPSKAVSAICSGSTICFFGNENSDTWQMFQNCGFYIKDLANLPSIFSSISSVDLESRKINARETGKKLVDLKNHAFALIYGSLKA